MSAQEAALPLTEITVGVDASLELIEGSLDLDPKVVEDSMLASIGRTMLVGSVRIPLLSVNAITRGNERVRQTHGDSARELIIAGPDAVIFDGEPVTRLVSIRTAELLGLVLLERRIARRGRYLDLGFFSESSSENSRGQTFWQASTDLERTILDSRERPLLFRDGARGEATLGVDDVIVKDIRHSTAYKQGRYNASLDVFSDFILQGGRWPTLSETSSILAARTVMRELAGSKLDLQQTARFASLAEQAAALTRHHTDEVRERELEDGTERERQYFRGQIVDLLSPRWQTRANCLSLPTDGLFYPVADKWEHKDARIEREIRAKAVCASCPVQEDCLKMAITNGEKDGVWGGYTYKERKRLLALL